MLFRIPIKRYVVDETLSWEEKYRALEHHHELETTTLISEIERLEGELSRRQDRLESDTSG